MEEGKQPYKKPVGRSAGADVSASFRAEAAAFIAIGHVDLHVSRRSCESAPNIDPSLLRSINHLGRQSTFGPQQFWCVREWLGR